MYIITWALKCQVLSTTVFQVNGDYQQIMLMLKSCSPAFTLFCRNYHLHIKSFKMINFIILFLALFVERKKALNDNTRVQKQILPFVTQYNPSVPNLKHILMEKWHLIESQPRLREMFKETPIISYKRGISLKDILVRAKL